MTSIVQKKRRSVRGNSRVVQARKKSANAVSAIQGSRLHGAPHGRTNRERRKMGKTSKRPSAPFGGVLSGVERARTFEFASAVKNNQLSIEAVDARYRQFVKKIVEAFE